MSKKKPLPNCNCPKDFLSKAKSEPNAQIIPGGKHPWKIVGPKGSMPVSGKGKEPYGKGLACAMRKQWIAIGLSPFIIIWLLSLLF